MSGTRSRGSILEVKAQLLQLVEAPDLEGSLVESDKTVKEVVQRLKMR